MKKNYAKTRLFKTQKIFSIIPEVLVLALAGTLYFFSSFDEKVKNKYSLALEVENQSLNTFCTDAEKKAQNIIFQEINQSLDKHDSIQYNPSLCYSSYIKSSSLKKELRTYPYTITDVPPENISFLSKALSDEIETIKSQLPKQTYLTPEIKLIGKNNNILAVMINDRNGELSDLNILFKEKMEKIFIEYKEKTSKHLYNLIKNNQIPFTPYIKIGTIHDTNIKEKYLGKHDKEVQEQIIYHIKELIVHKLNKMLKTKINNVEPIVFKKAFCHSKYSKSYLCSLNMN